MAWQACDACGKQRAKWYCAADNAHLCKQCDNSIHSANVVARRHKRLPIKNPRPSPTPTPRPTPSYSSSLTPAPRNGRDGSGNGSNIFVKEECSVISPLGCVLWHCSPKKLRSLRPFNLPKNKNKLLPPATPKPKPKPEPELEPEPETEIPDDDPYFDIDQLLLAEDPVNELDANFDEFFLFGGGEQILDMKKEDQSEEYKYSSSPLNSCLDDSSPRQESMMLSSSSPGCWLSDNLMTDMEQLCKEEEGDNLDDGELGCMKTEKLSLRLDYEELLSTWSDRGSAFSIQSQIVPDHHHPMDAITVGNPNSNSILYFGGLLKRLIFLCFNLREGQGQGHYEARSIYYGNSGQQEEILVPVLFHHPMMNMMNKLGREERVMRYREKRRTRLFSKIIRYEVRKLNAEKRPRLKGRFVRRTETETEDKSVGSDCIHPI